MNTSMRTVAAIALAALLGGCASAPPPNSGYLADYARLQQGQYLDGYWADAGIAQTAAPVAIQLDDISIEKISDKEGVTASECASWLQAAMEEGGVASTDAADATARMELAITFMDPGSAAARIWAGELGAGHAQVRVEGKVFDIESGKLLVAFAERRSSSGAIGLKDIGGDAGPSLVQQMIREIGGDLTNELRGTFQSGQ